MNTTTPTPAPLPEPAPEWVGIIAPPPKNDVMHCTSYVPEAGPVIRPGALHFKSIASHGYQC